jgi:hypothetical protein
MSAQTKDTQASARRVTIIWVSGLFSIFLLGILWLGSLGAAIFVIYRAHDGDEVRRYAVTFLIVLVALGAAFVLFVNRSYDWWLGTRANFLVSNVVDSYPIGSPASRTRAR